MSKDILREMAKRELEKSKREQGIDKRNARFNLDVIITRANQIKSNMDDLGFVRLCLDEISFYQGNVERYLGMEKRHGDQN